jgi:hypothetical protein
MRYTRGSCDKTLTPSGVNRRGIKGDMLSMAVDLSDVPAWHLTGL